MNISDVRLIIRMALIESRVTHLVSLTKMAYSDHCSRTHEDHIFIEDRETALVGITVKYLITSIYYGHKLPYSTSSLDGVILIVDE